MAPYNGFLTDSAMVILGLGGNSGDRATMLRKALELLAPVLKNPRISRIYETKALLPEGAPASWDMPFLNMAVMGETALLPQQLLVTIKNIEKTLGRTASQNWAPREIDIDILAMGNLIYEQAGLTIPHRGLLERDFALLPLAELAPGWHYPCEGKYHQWKATDIVADKGYISGSLNEQGIRIYG
jgi:2-amino-4-hydroxy-6-hydroxymethyldihydropteridine diphosphokinase